jgi:hypothetical protein
MKTQKKKVDKYMVLYKAIAKYIESVGGTAVVVGGIKIGQEWGARKFNYFIQIPITGVMPTFKTPSK